MHKPENELWCSVVTRADVADVRLAGREHFGRPEVADLHDGRLRIEKKVLRFDVPVADPLNQQ